MSQRERESRPNFQASLTSDCDSASLFLKAPREGGKNASREFAKFLALGVNNVAGDLVISA